MPQLLSYMEEGPVLVVQLERPESGNALNRELQRELLAAWEHLEAEDRLLVCVIHGSGGVFSVGHDVPELLNAADDSSMAAPLDGLFPYTLSKPVIAAVEGRCYGLGFELALACDLRISAEDARFGFPDTDLPVSYRLASVLLPRRVDGWAADATDAPGQRASGIGRSPFPGGGDSRRHGQAFQIRRRIQETAAMAVQRTAPHHGAESRSQRLGVDGAHRRLQSRRLHG